MTAERPGGPLRVFVDTSGFFAAIDGRDANHGAAISIMTRLAAEPSRLITTNFVLAESHALILRRLGRQLAREFLDGVAEGSTTVIRISVADEQRARAILAQYDDKDFSLTDATSFAVMDRIGLPSAFSFDRNFVQYGLRVLSP